MSEHNITIAWGQITVVSILFSLIGFFVGNRLALGRDRKKELIQAGKEFRKTFSETMRLLAINHPNHFTGGDTYRNTNNLLLTSYRSNYQAFIEFRPFVSKWKRKQFEKCWNTYCCCEKGQPTFRDYITETPSHHEELEKRNLATSRIDKLFEYTK